MNTCRHSLIFGLSYALDIAGKNNLSHSKSTAYLSVMIGRELGLDEDSVLDLYNAALLHDIGLSNSYDIRQHCIDGEIMLKELPLPESIAKDVYYHHEYYNGSGEFGLSGDSIPIGAQIISFASTFDDLFGKLSDAYNRNLYLVVQGWLDVNRELFSRAIVNAFVSLMTREFFLLDYFSYETKYTLSDKLVVGDDVHYGNDDILKYANCFANIIDCRSPFTFSHSQGIAGLAQKAAAYLGYSDDTCNTMYVAGLLHDIGKLYVSVDILHKKDKLTTEERFEINKHPYYTRKILGQIRGFEAVVNCAANHHEKLDGSGYPYCLPGDRLGELDKIMAICDVYQALTEERPYRGKLPPEKVWGIIDEMTSSNHLDKLLTSRLKKAFS